MPALLVEHRLVATEVRLVQLRRLVDLRLCHDLPEHITLQKVLQAEEADAVPTLVVATAALKVAVDVLSASTDSAGAVLSPSVGDGSVGRSEGRSAGRSVGPS